MEWAKSARVRVSIILLIASVIALVAVYFDNRDRDKKSIFFPLFSLFATILITDRTAAIFSDIFTEEEAKEAKEGMELLPGLFAGRNDVVVFSNGIEAQQYCNAVVPQSLYVRNTVFRYGDINSRYSTTYPEWIEIKKKCLLSKRCHWIEVVSQHLLEDDPQRIFMNEAIASKFLYNSYFIDDKANLLVQMTILVFYDRKEVLFGWPFPEAPHGPVFLTRNEKITEYFEQYFSHCIKISQKVGQEQKS